MFTSRRRVLHRRIWVGALLTACFFALPATAANAGRLLATGHDADFHCAPGPAASQACSYLQAAVGYVRGGAPDVTLPVLVIDQPPNQAASALANIGVPRVVVTPAAIPAVIDANTYSAVVVASDRACGGCDLNAPSGTADSALINARAPAFLSFFNDGGGLLALSGAANAPVYYDFLPLPVGGVNGAVPPFAPTPAGAAIGLAAANTNCNNCPTHNTFVPAPSLTVAENDATGKAATVIAEGTVTVVAGAPPVLTPPAIAPAGLDHFKCYTLTPTRTVSRTVGLRDQFGSKRARTGSPRQLCNPVAKTVRTRTTTVRNPRAHLTCYATRDVPAGVPMRAVRLRNQFGSVVTRTTRSQTLCVPSLKRIVPLGSPARPPAGANPERVLDHFRCYGVTPLGAARSVRLRDQFGRTSTRVIRLVRLCNPVQKTFRGATKRIQRRRAHLACYTIRDAARFRPRNVIVRNQLERRRLRAVRVETLCLPTFKQVLAVAGQPPAPTPTPVPTPVQFETKLTASSCSDGRVFVHTLRGSTDPARPGATATAVLSGPGVATPPSLTAVLADDGTFTATATTPTTTGVYRWRASVQAADGGESSSAVDIVLENPPPVRCPAPDLQFVSLTRTPVLSAASFTRAGGVTWTLTVKNAGNAAAGAFTATATASNEGGPVTRTFSFPSGIAAGASASRDANAINVASCPISISIDVANAVAELDETNNTASLGATSQLCTPVPG